MSEETFNIKKSTVAYIAVFLMIVGAIGSIAGLAYNMGKDTVAPVVIQQVAAPVVTPTPTPTVTQPVPTSATFEVYQKFMDSDGVQWIQTVSNEFYRVAFVNDYDRATSGYTYYAEFTGQITNGHQTIGTMSYISGAPVRVYSMQDNEYHTVNTPLVDTNTYEYHIYDKVLYNTNDVSKHNQPLRR